MPDICVIDIGSLDIDGPVPYAPLMNEAIIHCFDPQDMRHNTHRMFIHQDIIADGEKHTLYVCKAPGMTSLLEPDPRSLARFHQFSEWGTVVRKHPVETVRLDKYAIEPNMIKLDCQGGESLALAFAGRTLKSVDVIHIEVSFHTLYVNQILFSGVDEGMSDEGFEPYQMVALKHWPTDLGMMLLEADMVYIRRKPRNPTIMNHILHSCYGAR